MTTFVIGVAAFVFAFHFGMRYVLTYRLTDEDARAVLFGVLPVSVMRYEYIEEVRIINPIELLFRAAWRPQSKLVSRRAVMIQGRGFFGVIFTPDAEGFARELRRRVFQQTGRLPLGS